MADASSRGSPWKIGCLPGPPKRTACALLLQYRIARASSTATTASPDESSMALSSSVSLRLSSISLRMPSAAASSSSRW